MDRYNSIVGIVSLSATADLDWAAEGTADSIDSSDEL
jgi:hypothetical protein